MNRNSLSDIQRNNLNRIIPEINSLNNTTNEQHVRIERFLEELTDDQAVTSQKVEASQSENYKNVNNGTKIDPQLPNEKYLE